MRCWRNWISDPRVTVRLLDRLETRLPPPVLLAVLMLATWLAARSGSLHIALPAARAIGALVMLAGVALNVWPKRGFRQVGTTVNPMRPYASSQLVVRGPYRHSRNPMYLGHLLVMAGWGLWLQSGWGGIALLLQLAWLTRLQVMPEERALRARFGQAYVDYCARVRRWV